MHGSSPSSPSPAKPSAPDPWQAEEDHRTLSRSAEIQADPQRMRGVRKHHATKKRAMSKLGSMLKGTR
jgi:hypothetical protein